MNRTEVVVTGMGMVTPVGTSATEVHAAMCEGRSGLSLPPAGHQVGTALEVGAFGPPIEAASVLPATEARVVDRYIVMALRAAADALADAGLQVGRDVDPHRVAVILSGTGGLATLEAQVVLRTAKGRLGVSPYLLPGMLPNMGAARIAIKYGIRGYVSASGTACAAGGQAIGEGLRLLRAGEADVVVAGCSEAPLFPTLADAGVSTGDIGYLNAHGTSTKLGDLAEALAIRTLFGDTPPPVSSTKAVTGHMLGASGVVESAVAIHALRRGVLPPTHNLDDPDPECDLDHVRKGPRMAAIDHVISNSFGFGGHNVSVVYGHPSTRRTHLS